MRAVETGSSVGSSYVDALAYAVSSCVTEPSWRRGVRHGAGQPASVSPAHAKMPRGASEQHSGRSAMGCPHTWMGAGPALGAGYRPTFGQARIADLRWHPFDHTDPRLCRDDARQLEAGGFVERVELRFRALAPAGADEHVDIVGGGAAAGLRLVDARRVDTLDDQQAGRRPHRAAAALQDLCGVHVIPIVYDVL